MLNTVSVSTPKKAGRKAQLPPGSTSKSVKLEPDTFEFVRAAAFREHKQVAAFMREIIKDWVRAQRELAGAAPDPAPRPKKPRRAQS